MGPRFSAIAAARYCGKPPGHGLPRQHLDRTRGPGKRPALGERERFADLESRPFLWAGTLAVGRDRRTDPLPVTGPVVIQFWHTFPFGTGHRRKTISTDRKNYLISSLRRRDSAVTPPCLPPLSLRRSHTDVHCQSAAGGSVDARSRGTPRCNIGYQFAKICRNIFRALPVPCVRTGTMGSNISGRYIGLFWRRTLLRATGRNVSLLLLRGRAATTNWLFRASVRAGRGPYCATATDSSLSCTAESARRWRFCILWFLA